MEEQLQHHRLRAGIVPGMMGRMDVDLAVRPLGPPQGLFRCAGHGGRKLEDAHDRRSLRPSIAGGTTEDVVGGDAALPIRRAGQRNLRGLAGDKILDLDRVAHRVDVGVAGQEVIVDADASPRPDLQPGLDRQLVLRADAHAENHELGRQLLARVQPHDQPVGGLLKTHGRLAKQHGHALGGERLDDRRGHFLVQRRQDLVLQFDERRGNAPPHEVLDQFQPDEACATTTACLTPWSIRALIWSTSCRFRKV